MHRKPASIRGFTLLELMIVIALAALLMGLGIKSMGVWGEANKIRVPVDDVRVLAKKAWHLAIAEQRDWEIVIRPHGFEMRPKQAATQEDRQFMATADKALGRGSGVETKSYPEEISFAVRRFGEEKWQTPRPDSWVFQHSGICEPLLLRVERGDHWVELQFDPLTAGVQREEAD